MVKFLSGMLARFFAFEIEEAELRSSLAAYVPNVDKFIHTPRRHQHPPPPAAADLNLPAVNHKYVISMPFRLSHLLAARQSFGRLALCTRLCSRLGGKKSS